MICDLLKMLEAASLREAVAELLAESLSACEVGDAAKMLDLAQTARRVALECLDTVGEAVALVHVGAAQANLRKIDRAIDAFDQARRIFHRHPTLPQRKNEGIALFFSGLAYLQQRPSARTQAIASYQKALDILEQLLTDLRMAGDDTMIQNVLYLSEELHDRMASEIPRVFVDAEVHEVRPRAVGAEKIDEIRREQGSEPAPSSDSADSTTVPDDSGLIMGMPRRSIETSGETEENADQNTENRGFVRDEQGNIIFTDSEE